MRHRTQRFTSAVAVSRFNLPRKLIPFGINSIAFHLQLRCGIFGSGNFGNLPTIPLRRVQRARIIVPVRLIILVDSLLQGACNECFVSFSRKFQEHDLWREKCVGDRQKKLYVIFLVLSLGLTSVASIHLFDYNYSTLLVRL